MDTDTIFLSEIIRRLKYMLLFEVGRQLRTENSYQF
jgi:hypothetical protein